MLFLKRNWRVLSPFPGGYPFLLVCLVLFEWKFFLKKTSDLENVRSCNENGVGVILSHVLYIYCAIL